MASRRKTPALKAGRTGGFENVEATSTFELLNSSDGATASRTWVQRIFGLTGKYATPSWLDVCHAFFMETFATAFLSTLVVLARWSNAGAFPIAVVYAVALWAATRRRWYGTHSLRRHLSGPVTLAYFFTGDIGLLGVVFYKCAQLLGSLIGGAVLSTLIGGVYVAGKLPVPFPTTVDSSLTTAVCLEIFVTGVIVLIYLINEFLNTDESKREKNYNHSATYMAGIMFVVVMVSYQFQAWTFNDNVYLTGLFSGFQKDTASLLGIPLMAQLDVATGYTNSVFTHGAWALYYFGAWAGGVAAAIIFWPVFYVFSNDAGEPLPRRMEGYKNQVPFGSALSPTQYAASQEAAKLDDLVSPLKR